MTANGRLVLDVARRPLDDFSPPPKRLRGVVPHWGHDAEKVSGPETPRGSRGEFPKTACGTSSQGQFGPRPWGGATAPGLSLVDVVD